MVNSYIEKIQKLGDEKNFFQMIPYTSAGKMGTCLINVDRQSLEEVLSGDCRRYPQPLSKMATDGLDGVDGCLTPAT